MKGKKTRLDLFCSETGLSGSREKAKREILSGWVKVNGETVRDPSKTVFGNEDVVIERPGGLYVSRGGEKLHHALEHFNISLKEKTAADLGASTGGFTDCMLKFGALKVYAVDVGYGQLDYSLQRDSRVVIMDRTNVRHLTPDFFSEKIEFISVDLSFISIVKVAEVIKNLFPSCEGVILIKPQFEANPGEQKKGVVRKAAVHEAILSRTLTALVEMGYYIKGLTFSPIKGPAGNIEFLLYFDFLSQPPDGADAASGIESLVRETVEAAHGALS